MIHIEHLGEMDYREVDGRVEAVGLPEQSYLWVRNNQRLIDMAIQAVKTNDVRRIQVVAPERTGVNGGIQQWWWGVGVLGFYWTTTSGIERWSCDHALRQIKTMTQLTTFLMQADLADIQPQQS